MFEGQTQLLQRLEDVCERLTEEQQQVLFSELETIIEGALEQTERECHALESSDVSN